MCVYACTHASGIWSCACQEKKAFVHAWVHMQAFTRIKRKQPLRNGRKVVWYYILIRAAATRICGFILNNNLKGPIETHFAKTDERDATILLCACCNNILLTTINTPLARPTAAGSRRTRLLCSRSHLERSVHFCSWYLLRLFCVRFTSALLCPTSEQTLCTSITQ